MFLLNLGYRLKLASTIEGLDGVIFLPSKNGAVRLTRSSFQEHRHVLMDPQLYLADLDVNKCAKTCANLASYPWFEAKEVPEFDSGEQTPTAWKKLVQEKVASSWLGQVPEQAEEACKSCVEFQVQLSCSQIILPSPMIIDREDEAQTQADWLDVALTAVNDLDVGQPVLATIALSDIVLNSEALLPGGFLDTIADQITAREDIDGVYIVVAKTANSHPFERSEETLRAYLKLSRLFRDHGYAHVLTNFCDVFGLVCKGIGATTFATGPSHALRQLCLAGFEDDRFGIALPHFYSHRIIGELRTEEDLDRIVANRLLRRVRDTTPFSRTLMKELENGGSARNLTEWAESRNNVACAQGHFLNRMVAAEKQTTGVAPDEQPEAVRGWLEDAGANGAYVLQRIAPEKLTGRLAPADDWLSAFDEVHDA